MSVGKTVGNHGGRKIGFDQLSLDSARPVTDLNSDSAILESAEATLESINLEEAKLGDARLNVSQINFSGVAKTTSQASGGGHGGGTNNNGKTTQYSLDQIEQHIIDGTFEKVVDTVVKPKFVKESYEKADAQGKADIKVLAAVAIASHGEAIAEGMRKKKTADEIKDIPEHHIADVMKMSIQFGASSKSMNAFMNILHDAGKLTAVMEHVFRDVKSSDLINITSTIVRLGLDPTPITCAQTAFRLMAYALDRTGVQKNIQPTLFKFVSTMARGFQLGSSVLQVAGDTVGVGMVSGVSSFLVHRVIDYSLSKNVTETIKCGDQDMQFSEAIQELQKESEKNQQEREKITKKRESEREAKRQEVRNVLQQSQKKASTQTHEREM